MLTLNLFLPAAQRMVMLLGLGSGCGQPLRGCPHAGWAPGVGRREGRGLQGWLLPPAPGRWVPCLLLAVGEQGSPGPQLPPGWAGALGKGRPLPLSQCPLSPQRLKDEIAEVTNEIENLGSTEEK